jgi:hypothetical protein
MKVCLGRLNKEKGVTQMNVSLVQTQWGTSPYPLLLGGAKPKAVQVLSPLTGEVARSDGGVLLSQ